MQVGDQFTVSQREQTTHVKILENSQDIKVHTHTHTLGLNVNRCLIL